jgi:YggT family protein
MAIVLLVLYLALTLFILIMWIRFVLDLVVSISRNWHPHGFGLVLAEITFTVTDPPIKVVRRIIPPLRLGGLVFDLSWGIVLIVAIILSSLISLNAGFRF